MPIQYDSEGIITQTLSEILDEKETSLKAVLGEDFVIDSTSPIGSLALAVANSELAIQELIAYLIPNQIDANTATGRFLDAICEKNRIVRKQPQYTTVDLIINGEKGSQIIKGDLTISESIKGNYYDLNEDVVVGEDGTVKAEFICEDYGEFYPYPSSTFTILTPVNGIESVTIDYDNSNIVIGRLVETDDELRRRRYNSVEQASTTTLVSMKSGLYGLDGVEHVTYFENDTETTNVDGLPLKSFEYVVDGGDEDEITDVIFLNKPVGTRAYGTTVIIKTDSEGNIYNIGYTKADKINVGMKISVKVSSLQSATWQNKVKQSIKDKFDNVQGIGQSVKPYNYFAVLTGFSEIVDIDSLEIYNIEDETPVYQTQYTIHKKEIAKLEVENIELILEAE